MAAGSKAWVCGRSPAEVVGSNPTGGMDVCCECCVLSGRGLCGELITRPEESYRLWRVVVYDFESSGMREPWTTGGCCAPSPPPKKRRGYCLRCALCLSVMGFSIASDNLTRGIVTYWTRQKSAKPCIFCRQKGSL